MFAAVMGGSAVVAMGALSVALHEEQASEHPVVPLRVQPSSKGAA